MEIISRNHLKWLQYKLFEPFEPIILCGSLTKFSPFLKKNCETFDLNLGNESVLTLKNYNEVKNTLNFKEIVFSKQVHGDRIICIDSPPSSQIECDGFITSKCELTLIIKHADCQAALFYDPSKKVIGALHAGWRGQKINIYNKMIKTMGKEYGCNPQDILVAISPSLGPKNSQFINFAKEWPKNFWRYKDKNSFFDLWKMAEDQLREGGILEKNIEIAKIDTYKSLDFFSYRKNKGCGRNISFIMQREPRA